MHLRRFFIFVLPFSCVLVGSGSFAQTTVPLQITRQGLLTLQVSINGSGPHRFLLDTGSNKTVVQQELLQALRVASGTETVVNSTAGTSQGHRSQLSRLAVSGLTVHDFEVESAEASEIAPLGEPIEGILGEDFLKRFDILIDNEAKTLTLDDTPALSVSLAGNRLPLSFSGSQHGEPTPDRPVIHLTLPYSNTPGAFLIDSGANYPVYFPAHKLPFLSHTTTAGTLRTFGGGSRCYSLIDKVSLGKKELPAVQLALCDGVRGRIDVDGVLPISIFKRLFISRRGAYAIVNPRPRKVSGSAVLTAGLAANSGHAR